jgi:hypothetical protein
MTGARETLIAICWECETETARPATVRLRLPSGASSILVLCPSCHRRLSGELAAGAAGEVSFQATPPELKQQGRRDADQDPR